ALSLHLHMLLGLDSLMKPVGITAARHDTAGKFINNKNLVVLNHIVLILMHQIVGAQSKDDIVLDLQVLRIRKVLNVEEILHLLHAALCKVDDLIFLIYDEVSGLHNLFAHNGGHLGHLMAGLAALKLLGQDIADFIELGGVAALTGNDQRGTGLVDKHGVHLVDDTVVKFSLYKLFLVDYHVVTKVIKSQLVIGHIGDVASVSRTSLLRLHIVQYHAHGKTQEFMNLTHPLGVTLCQIVVD